MNWQKIWVIFGLLFSVISFLPLINSTHWFFRIADFVRLHLLIILFMLLAVGIIFLRNDLYLTIVVNTSISLAIVYHLIHVVPYLPKKSKINKQSSNGIKVISVNVMQKNKHYEKLIDLVNTIKPDILLTLETNKTWERNLTSIENNFKYIIKVPLENRYGIHLYSNLEIKKHKVNYLISKEHPSVEVHLVDDQNKDFILWGIHPPPPSPTEKPTSKQKDAELMKLAELVLKAEVPVVVLGDCNNVCWSKSSKLFCKFSKLMDARINRGILGTFPSYIWLIRIPIDLIFHSSGIIINKLKVLNSIGSDHLPLLSEFSIGKFQKKKSTSLSAENKKIVDLKIKEGKEAAKVEN